MKTTTQTPSPTERGRSGGVAAGSVSLAHLPWNVRDVYAVAQKRVNRDGITRYVVPGSLTTYKYPPTLGYDQQAYKVEAESHPNA